MQANYPRNPRATLWPCFYGGPTSETHWAILNEVRQWGPNLAYHTPAAFANIDRGRSYVASAFLRQPPEEAGDVLLMVDHDNAWRPGDLARLAKRALEHTAVVGGIYPKRAFGQGAALRVAPDTEGTWQIGEDRLIPAEFVGTGFIAIPRLVLERLAETLPLLKGDIWPFFMPFVIPGRDGMLPEYPTDDQAFCWRVLEAGFPVYASTAPRVTHVGPYQFRMIDGHTLPLPDEDLELVFNGNPHRMQETAHAE